MSQSTAITERALVYLHPDDDVTDSSSKAGKIFEDLLATISKQQGFVAGHWGRRLGDENIAEHIVGTKESCPLFLEILVAIDCLITGRNANLSPLTLRLGLHGLARCCEQRPDDHRPHH